MQKFCVYQKRIGSEEFLSLRKALDHILKTVTEEFSIVLKDIDRGVEIPYFLGISTEGTQLLLDQVKDIDKDELEEFRARQKSKT